MTFEEFIKKWTNKPIDFDGIYPNQCMDLMHQFVYEVLVLKDKSILAAPSAKEVFNNFKWNDLFEKIKNTPEGIPKKGDLVFWGSGEWGHVAIFIEGDINRFSSFDANWPVGSLPHIEQHNYNGVLGWLSFKGYLNPVDELEKKIMELEKEIEGLRKSRNEWRKKFKEMEKKYNPLLDNYEKLENKYDKLLKENMDRLSLIDYIILILKGGIKDDNR